MLLDVRDSKRDPEENIDIVNDPWFEIKIKACDERNLENEELYF